jgi:hypothetical protein
MLVKDIVKHTGVSESTARTIAKERLDDVRNKLKTIGADVADSSSDNRENENLKLEPR